MGTLYRRKKQNKVMNRALVRAVKTLDVLVVTGLFTLCWILYYDLMLEQPYHLRGNAVIAALYLFCYYLLAHLYEGFLIHIRRISELVFSQAMAAMISDFLLYVVMCLLLKRVPFAVPMILCAGCQLAAITLWCLRAHLWYFRRYPTLRSLVIWDLRQGMEELIRQYGMEQHFKVVGTPRIDKVLKDMNRYLLDDIEVVFLCGIHSHARNRILKYCVDHDIVTYVIPRVGDVLMSAARPMHLFRLPMMQMTRYNPTPEYLLIKRLLDVIIAALALILLSPLMLVLAIAIKTEDGGTVFYRQERLTKDARVFRIIKFRSMYMDAEANQTPQLSAGRDDPRVTRTGRFLRRFRLDEIPQFVNILRGEMSLVGPRPERPELAQQYQKRMPEFSLRTQVKAGLTGYAQVYGKYNSTPYDKLLLDLMYIAKPGLAEDFKIILATLRILFLAESTEGVQEDMI